ncbi:UNVERIFIED_CONTAM: hypothetical protein Sradi_0572900 [Sesamum radiatum]|uniref:Uncharacterized protein n=1 Tax=Sesamum radiatum TaxID=300843 RepID=A0AAW2VI91_SESRA
MDSSSELKESSKDNKVNDGVSPDSRNFDLNAGVDEENSEKMASNVVAAAASTASGPPEVKGDEYPGLSEMDRMAIDPVHLAQLSSRLDEDEEDYDEEG